MDRKFTTSYMRWTLRRKLRCLGTFLLCVTIIVSMLPPPHVSRASPPPANDKSQAADAFEPADGSETLLASSVLTESVQSQSILRKATDGLPPAGIQKTGMPTSAEEARQLGWHEVKVHPPQAPDANIKFFLNELAQPKPVSQYTRPTLKPLEAADLPRLKVRPEYLQFAQTAAGLLPVSQPLYIHSTTTPTVNFSLSEDIPWLDVDLTNGTAGADPVSTLVTVDTTGLSLENSPYTGDLIITNLDDPTDVWQVRVRLALTDTYAAATLYSFDANGNLQRRIRPDGSIIDYEYDELGCLTGVQYPDGNTVTYTYDANGNRTSILYSALLYQV